MMSNLQRRGIRYDAAIALLIAWILAASWLLAQAQQPSRKRRHRGPRAGPPNLPLPP